MYNKVDTNMNFVDREKETEKFWRENDIFKKSSVIFFTIIMCKVFLSLF